MHIDNLEAIMADVTALHDHTPSDWFLVRRAKVGDPQATKYLLERYKQIIWFKAAPYHLPDGDRDDLLQEGRFGLMKAIRDYRPDRDASFHHFAELCIHRQIITAVNTATCGKHQLLNSSVRFTRSERDVDEDSRYVIKEEYLRAPSVDQPVELLIRQEFLEKLCILQFITLTELEAWALAMFLAGYSYIETAAHLKINEKSVDNALQRSRRKLKPILKLAA